MFVNMLTVARCQGHNVVGAKGVRSNLVFCTLSFLPFAHPRRFFNVTSFGNLMPNLCLVHVIWTGCQMTNLVLNVCFDFFS